jgi:hypothetical protein
MVYSYGATILAISHQIRASARSWPRQTRFESPSEENSPIQFLNGQKSLKILTEMQLITFSLYEDYREI